VLPPEQDRPWDGTIVTPGVGEDDTTVEPVDPQVRADLPDLDLRWQFVAGRKPLQMKEAELNWASLEHQADELGREGFVPTVISRDGDNMMQLAAYRTPESPHQYEARVRHVDSDKIESAMRTWGSEGYLITRVLAEQSGYTVVGVRFTDLYEPLDTVAASVPSDRMQETLDQWGEQGVIVSSAVNRDGQWMLVGQRPAGTSRTWAGRMIKTHVSDAASLAEELATRGYVVTDAVRSGESVVFFAFHDAERAEAFTARAKMVRPSKIGQLASQWNEEHSVMATVSAPGKDKTLVIGYQR
jgi:hypothetical protein